MMAYLSFQRMRRRLRPMHEQRHDQHGDNHDCAGGTGSDADEVPLRAVAPFPKCLGLLERLAKELSDAERLARTRRTSAQGGTFDGRGPRMKLDPSKGHGSRFSFPRQEIFKSAGNIIF